MHAQGRSPYGADRMLQLPGRNRIKLIPGHAEGCTLLYGLGLPLLQQLSVAQRLHLMEDGNDRGVLGSKVCWHWQEVQGLGAQAVGLQLKCQAFADGPWSFL